MLRCAHLEKTGCSLNFHIHACLGLNCPPDIFLGGIAGKSLTAAGLRIDAKSNFSFSKQDTKESIWTDHTKKPLRDGACLWMSVIFIEQHFK